MRLALFCLSLLISYLKKTPNAYALEFPEAEKEEIGVVDIQIDFSPTTTPSTLERRS